MPARWRQTHLGDGMQVQLLRFGSVEVEGRPYENDIVIEVAGNSQGADAQTVLELARSYHSGSRRVI